ncbi:hypothetical protein IGI04_014245 [Brassica rapa subsp. trilocularis]|uniref:Uncharacterized protein n=1 Tax=Brassica rapa subsp. trilocularis TaxID=1813537 RepID=A0ABQ7MLN9_BRACM|nr:hypothetical protein IGI04_014245 [Brassica rapa subsp. trilocularis]
MEWSSFPYNASLRTLSLEALIMLLSGHQSAGTVIASREFTRTLYSIFTGLVMAHRLFQTVLISLGTGRDTISGSDDGTAKLWDMRQRGAIQTFPDKYQITAVSFSDAADNWYEP